MKTTPLTETNCPACGKRFSAATAAFGEFTPKPGDWTICIDCGVVLAFDQTLTPRTLTEAEQREADADPDIRKMRHVYRVMQHLKAHQSEVAKSTQFTPRRKH
jgi:hypothetical protein